MLRFLTIIVGLIVIVLLLKGYFRSLQRRNAPAAKPAEVENMVRCSHCGVNVPQTEAIFSGGDYFCCDEHRRLRQR